MDYLRQDEYNSAVEQIFVSLSFRVNEEYAYQNNDMLGFEPVIKPLTTNDFMNKSEEKEIIIMVVVFSSAMFVHTCI